MSLTGKSSDLLPDGQGSHAHGHVHVDSVSTHAPAGAIIVPDAHLLFTGDFKRSGVDLVLSADDRKLVLHDYFKGETRAALASPDGAHLTGDIVNALSGYTQFAQADGSASVAQVIGHVTKLTGTATVIRNGVSIILNQGDNVNKGDVVQSGSNSSLGITFIDGSVFGLASNAKMVLNEMIYDPNGSNNSSLISLVQGTISFVAGATAKHGDMKVDTPVATMGIRGTAVLVEIDFEVPGQGGAPPAKFQVLVEPDGTTGSYILFDKTTLTPIATVNQAGTQTIVNGQGTVSFLSSAQLSADAQKIITDVFAQKFTDNTNPKDTTHFTDSIVPQTTFGTLGSGQIIPVTVQVGSVPDKLDTSGPSGPTTTIQHINQAPVVATRDGAFTENAGLTHSSAIDTVSGTIRFGDINGDDRPTAKATFDSFKYENAHHDDVTASLTAEQLAAIHAVEIPLVVVQDPGNNNNGSATWTYSIADSAFDFLGVGETLTLTYMAEVDNNYSPNDQKTSKTFTITITGTNDVPTIATSGGAITELLGTGNSAVDTASGTITFTDVDLTDRPVVSANISSSDPFRYLDAQGHDVSGFLTDEQKAAILAVQVQLTVVPAAGNTHNGSATWTYSVADKAFDFLAKGETLTLNYVVQVNDGHGGVVSTPISVSINGADISVTGTNDIPTIATTSNAFVELSNVNQPNPTGSTALDKVTGTINFTDVDLTDRPLASAAFTSFTYTDGSGHALTLTAQQQNDVAAVAVPVSVTPAAGNTNNGSATWTYSVADGAFDFLAAGEILTLTYTATVDDGQGGVVTKPFTVTITGTNDTPTIAATSNAFVEASNESQPNPSGSTALDTVTGTISFADVDLTDRPVASAAFTSFTYTDALHHPLTLTAQQQADVTAVAVPLSVTQAAGNTNNGSASWTYSVADGAFDFLAAGEILTLTYTATVADGHGGVITKPFTITITGTNDTPIATADSDTGHIVEAGNAPDDSVIAGVATTSGDVLLNDTDVDLTDTHEVVGVAAGTASGVLDGQVGTTVNGIYGWLVLNADGSWTYTLDNSRPATDALAKGVHVSDVFSYTESDHNGGTATATLTIDVTGTNDAPVTNVAPLAVTDVNAGAPIVEQGVHPGNTPLAGVSTATGNVLSNDFDIDTGDSKTVQGVASGTSSGPLTGYVATAVGGSYGSVMIAADGSWTYTLDNSRAATQALTQGQHAFDVFTYTMHDADGATASATLTIDITGSNDAPTLANINAGKLTDTAGNDSFGTLTGTLTGTDLDNGETATLTYVALDATGHPVTAAVAGLYGTLTVHADGTYSYVADASAINALHAGTHTDIFTVQTADVNGATGTATFTVDVTGANDTPTLAKADAGTLTDTAANDSFGNLTGTLAGADRDSGETATLTYATLDATSHAVTTAVAGLYGALTVNADGTYSYVADASAINGLHAGTYADIFTVQTTDANGATASATLTVDVIGSNDTPTLAPVNAGTLADTAANDSFGDLTGTLVGSDADSGETAALTYAVLDATSHPVTTAVAGLYGALTVHADGTYSYVADASAINALQAGSHTDTFTVQTTDGHGATGTALLTVNVTGTDDTPVITSDAAAASGAVTQGSNVDDSGNIGSSGTLSFTDAELADTHTATVAFTSSHSDTHLPGFAEGATQIGTFTIDPSVAEAPGSGSLGWSFTLADDDELLQALGYGQTITETYTVSFDDHHGGIVTQPVTVTINGVNDAPTITSGAQSASISEIAGAYGSTTADQASGTINFADLDVTDTHAMAITGVVASGITSGLPDNATLLSWLTLGPLTDSGNGAVGSDSWTFSAPDHYFDYLADDVTATLSYTVQLDDHHGGLVTQPVTVTITGSHDAGDDTTNVIPGTEREDVLVSTAANDLMTGLAGDDQFVFNTTAGNTGHDVIADFVPGQDKISLDYAAFTASGANDFSHWLASHAVAAGNDVFIDLNPGGVHPNQDTILLKNLTMANLHASDFILPSGGH